MSSDNTKIIDVLHKYGNINYLHHHSVSFALSQIMRNIPCYLCYIDSDKKKYPAQPLHEMPNFFLTKPNYTYILRPDASHADDYVFTHICNYFISPMLLFNKISRLVQRYSTKIKRQKILYHNSTVTKLSRALSLEQKLLYDLSKINNDDNHVLYFHTPKETKLATSTILYQFCAKMEANVKHNNKLYSRINELKQKLIS